MAALGQPAVRLGFSRVYKIFAEAGLHERVVFVGSRKLGLQAG